MAKFERVTSFCIQGQRTASTSYSYSFVVLVCRRRFMLHESLKCCGGGEGWQYDVAVTRRFYMVAAQVVRARPR